MNNDEMVLIHENTYLSHVNDKVRLYAMLKQLIHQIRYFDRDKDYMALMGTACRIDRVCEEMFDTWEIPKSYVTTGDERDLIDLMDSELLDPEEAGYVLCDEDCDCCCPCGDDERCCEYAERIEQENSDSAEEPGEDTNEVEEFMVDFMDIMHELFGENIKIHIRVE